MSGSKLWEAITGLGAELKRCDDCGLTTASLAFSFVFIDTFANLARPNDKQIVTRSDFIKWVNHYLKGHPDQPYAYRGKDVYAARCAFLHTYGSIAKLHEDDHDIKIFVYHNGGMHNYDRNIDERMVVIGTKSFVNDVFIAGKSFLKDCMEDTSLRDRVEARLPQLLSAIPLTDI